MEVSPSPPPAFSALSLRHQSTSCHPRFCWLQSPPLHEPLTCIVEVEESVPSGFEVSSREKEGTYVISLSNYFHYKKFPYLFFSLFEMALRRYMPDCHEQGCTFQTVARTKNRKAWFAQDVYNITSSPVSFPHHAEPVHRSVHFGPFECLQQHQKGDKPMYSTYSTEVSREFLLPRQRMNQSIHKYLPNIPQWDKHYGWYRNVSCDPTFRQFLKGE